MRKIILDNYFLDKIIRLPDDVFYGVKAETLILILGKPETEVECFIFDRKEKIINIEINDKVEVKSLNQKNWKNNPFYVFDIYTDTQIKSLIDKIERERSKLVDLCDFSLGITPYDKYKGHTKEQIENRVFHSEYKKDATFKPLIEGGDITKYHAQWRGKEYLSYGNWLSRPREKRFFTQPRILVRQIISGIPPQIFAAYSEIELFNTHSIFNILKKPDTDLDLKFILGLINSRLLNFYHRNKYLDQSKRLFQKILIQDCKTFPIPKIDLGNEYEKSIHDEIVKNVEFLIEMTIAKAVARLQTKILQLESKVEYYESKLNELVYQLYDLTPKEIEIIEKQDGNVTN